MLFKTENRNGILFCELPLFFNFEILSKESDFATQKENCIFSDFVEYRVTDEKETVDEHYRIPKDTKHIYFEKKNQSYHIFFLKRGYIIKEKGKTIETL